MKKQNKISKFSSIILLSIFILNVNANYGSLMSKTWILSCVPCVDILNECSSCLKDNCVTCVTNIPNSGCKSCISDVLGLTSNFICDARIEYHQVVCKLYEIYKNKIVFKFILALQLILRFLCDFALVFNWLSRTFVFRPSRFEIEWTV